MVDIRAAGAPPQEVNGTSPENHNQVGGAGDMGNQSAQTPVSGRASTPATTNSLSSYSGVNPGATAPPMASSTMPSNMPYNCGPYMCGMKSVLWCPPHSPPQPLAPGMAMGGIGGMGLNVPHPISPMPPGVNPHVFKSVQANGADLPMNDIATLRYFFNLGLECMWAMYGPPLPPPPHPLHPPQRHYSPANLVQDMQQMSVQDRPGHGEQNHNKHKQEKNSNGQGKGNGQRPLLGPRFKRNNQDNNQSNNQNKGHNSSNNHNINNKGPNNRRNSYADVRGSFSGEEAGGAETPIVAFPYAPYPPPLYPVPYYHVDDPGMMGMMGGMGGMGYVYEEGMEFGMQPMYGAPPPFHPHLPPAPLAPVAPHEQHK